MVSGIFKKPLPYLAILLAHLIWGTNYVVAKITLREFPVMSLGFLRFALACLLIAPFLIAERKKIKIKLEDLPSLILVGLTMVTFNIVFSYEGLNRTTAINTSVLSLLVPIFSVLGAWWFLRQKIYWINLVGIIVGLLGTVLIVGLPLLLLGNLTSEQLLGNFLIIASDIFFVIGALISQRLLKKYSALVVTSIAFLVAMISFLFPAINEYQQNPAWVNNVTILGVLGLLFIVLLSSISAYFAFQWGISKTDVVKATLFEYIEPAVAATLAVPILGERISFSFIVGTVLIILGVYWGTLGKVEHHHLQHRGHRS